MKTNGSMVNVRKVYKTGRWIWLSFCMVALLGATAGPVFGAFSDDTATLTNSVADASSFPGERVQVGDFDSDGDPDFSINGRLWRNDISDTGFYLYLGPILDMGPWGDHNNDGKPDLYGWQSGYMYTNLLDGPPFTSSAPNSNGDPNMPDLPAGVDKSNGTQRSACWGDWDKDGDLDLYVAGSQATGGDPTWPDVILDNGLGEDSHSFHLSTIGSPNYYARGTHPCDYDEDGDLDIFVCNYFWQPNRLWQNDGSGSFSDVGGAAGVAGSGGMGASIGAAWGDLDNDGDFDLILANLNHGPTENAIVYENLGSPTYTFSPAFDFSGADYVEAYASPVLFDYDNDGDLDIFITDTYVTDSRLYRNDGSFTFVNVTGTEMASVSFSPTGQAAVLDWDDDGDLDLITGGKMLVNNNNNGNHWLKVKIEGTDAVVYGARVTIDLGGGNILTRQVNEMMGEGNQNERIVHFGLGANTGPVDVAVTSIGCSTANLNTAVDQTVTINLNANENLPEDLNGDCFVNFLDFAILQANYMKCNNPGDLACDVIDVDPAYDPNADMVEDFEGNPDISAAPWSQLYGGGVVGTPNAGNPNDGGNLSMNFTDFTVQRLDVTHASIDKELSKGSLEFDYYHGVGWNRIHLSNTTNYNIAWINIWGNGGGANYEISFMDSVYVPNHEAQDVITPGTWNQIRVDWDMDTQLLSLALNDIPVPGMQNVPGMEPGLAGGNTLTRVTFYDYSGTGLDPMQIDNIKIHEETPVLPYWIPATDPTDQFFPMDFEDSPDVTTAPWSYSMGGGLNVPQLGTGEATNTSIVLDPLDFTNSHLDLTDPVIDTVYEKGTVQFDMYYSQGVSRIHLKGALGWNVCWLDVRFDGPDNFAEISLQRGDHTTMFREPNAVEAGTWSTYRIDWDTSTELLSIFVNGAPLANLQDVDGMEPNRPGGYGGTAVERVEFYAWTGTGDTMQVDNICVANEPAKLCQNLTYIISGNVGVPGVTLEGFPGDPVISGAGGAYSAKVSVDTLGGAIIPKLDGYIFTPANKVYDDSLSGNLTSEDYTAVAIDCDLMQALGHIIVGDITEDCYVNVEDVGGLSLEWLSCNDPNPLACP
jgi:hypothetical protein